MDDKKSLIAVSKAKALNHLQRRFRDSLRKAELCYDTKGLIAEGFMVEAEIYRMAIVALKEKG